MSAALAAVLLLPLFAPLSDELTLSTKPPVAQVKASSKTALKTYKTSAAAALKELDTALDVLEAELDADTSVTELSSSFYEPVAACLDRLAQAQFFARRDVEGTVSAVLNQVQPQEPVLQGQFPPDLLYGGGGVLDSHRAKLAAAVSKSHAALRKRLARTVALAESRAGIGLSVLVAPDVEEALEASSMGVDLFATYLFGVDFDLAFSVSRLGVVSDAVLVASGRSISAGWEVSFHRGAGAIPTPAEFDLRTGRFFALCDKGIGTGALEGSWVLVLQRDGDWVQGLSLGVR